MTEQNDFTAEKVRNVIRKLQIGDILIPVSSVISMLTAYAARIESDESAGVSKTFQCEDRYIVIKKSHLNEFQLNGLEWAIGNWGISTVQGVVVEADWPEHEPVWAMIRARMTNPPAQAAQVDTSNALLRGRALDEEPRVSHSCTMGVGCEEAGVCYASAHGQPDQCGRPTAEPVVQKDWALFTGTIGGVQVGLHGTRESIEALDAFLAAQPLAVPDGWTGWACQFPGNFPRLYGARTIAELNLYAEDGDRLIYLVESADPSPGESA